jgi:hypothetical protein
VFLVLVLMAGVLSAAVWVYRDARDQAAKGNPVVFSADSFEIRTPSGWFLACALAFEIFVPAYLDSRRPA